MNIPDKLYYEFNLAAQRVDRLQAEATISQGGLQRANRVARLLDADIRLQKAAQLLKCNNDVLKKDNSHSALDHRARHMAPLPGWLCIKFRLAQTASFLALDAARDNNKLYSLLSAYNHLVRLGKEIGKRRADALGFESISEAWIDYFNPGIRLSQLHSFRSDIETHAHNKLDILAQHGHTPITFPSDELSQIYLKQLGQRLLVAFLGQDKDVVTPHFKGQPKTEGTPNTVHLNFGDNEKRAFPFMANAYHELCHARLLANGLVANRAIDETSAKTGDIIFTTRDNAEFISQLAEYELQIKDSRWEVGALHAAINTIDVQRPRVEADLLTAPLHTCVRMDIDEAMMEDKARPRELPEYWQAGMKYYLGVDVSPEDVTRETLPLLGRFWEMSSYFIGDIAAPQLYSTLETEKPDMTREFHFGHFQNTVTNIGHKLNMKDSVLTNDVIQKATGQFLSTAAWKHYVDQRVFSISSQPS